MPWSKMHRNKINQLIDQYVHASQQEYDISDLHKDRQPNTRLFLPLDGRLDIESVQFDLMNIYLDAHQFEELDLERLNALFEARMYQQLAKYISHIQELMDEMMSEQIVHVYMPSHFSTEGYTNVFGQLLQVDSPLEAVTVDGQVVETNKGLLFLEDGWHEIEIPQNCQVYDISWTAVSDVFYDRLFKQKQDTKINVLSRSSQLYVYRYKLKGNDSPQEYVPQEYIQAPQDSEYMRSLKIDVFAHVVNYHYAVGDDIYVVAKDYVDPIVCAEFLRDLR